MRCGNVTAFESSESMTLSIDVSGGRSARSVLWPLLVLSCLLAGTRSISAAEVARNEDSAVLPLKASSFPLNGVRVPIVLSLHGAMATPGGPTAFAAESVLYTEEALASGAEQAPGAEAARDIMRYAVDTVLGVCLGRDNDKCRTNVAAVFDLMNQKGLTAAMFAEFRAVRNNMYFYVVAPNFLLAKNILSTRRPCAEWDKMAGDTTPVPDLLRNADLELGTRNNVAERKELKSLTDRYKKNCSAA
jgi:hypothetical protein